MSKWHGLLEYFQFPLKVLFIATILLGVGSSIINPNISFLWSIDNSIIQLVSEMMRYVGGFLIQMFPLFVFIKLLTRKFEDSVPVFIGFVSFLLINVIVLFLENTNAVSYFYGNIMGIQMSFGADSIFGEVTRIPYNTGILTLVIAYFITIRCYLKSRHFTMHGILSFIDHDTWAMLMCFVLSIVFGVLIAYGWPLVISILNMLFEYLSRDILNPMNMFIYGFLDRISLMLGTSGITREAFWLSELGGTATDNFGVLYNGDVNTWFALQNLNIVTTNAGHLITPYYVINIFLIPGFLLGYFSMVSNVKDRHRYILFFLLAIVLSVVCGNAFPMEIFMLILSPLLYVLYLVIVAMLFTVFQIMGVSIGYTMTGSLMVANPGSLLDVIQFLRNPDMIHTLTSVGGVGLFAGVFFMLATRSYFRKYAIGLFSLSDRKEVTLRVIDYLGGIKNITQVESTPDKLTVGLKHRERVDFDALREEGAYTILESKEGYLIRLGNLSTIVAKEIKKSLEQEEKNQIE